jgi:putative membrane protein
MMGFGVIGLLLMLLFWGGLVFLAIWLVKALFQGDSQWPAPPPEKTKTAREILDERYARGEITREQYELIQQDIS